MQSNWVCDWFICLQLSVNKFKSQSSFPYICPFFFKAYFTIYNNSIFIWGLIFSRFLWVVVRVEELLNVSTWRKCPRRTARLSSTSTWTKSSMERWWVIGQCCRQWYSVKISLSCCIVLPLKMFQWQQCIYCMFGIPQLSEVVRSRYSGYFYSSNFTKHIDWNFTVRDPVK